MGETMEISKRQQLILKTIVEQFIATAEPIGSKSLAGAAELNVSSATIRSEMNELTRQGLLEQPYTSAGRIPTAAGYRVYVNALMQEYNLAPEEAAAIAETLHRRNPLPDEMVADTSKLTSRLTTLPSYAMQAVSTDITVERLELIHIDDHNFIIVALLSNKQVKNRLVTLPESTSRDTLQKIAAVFNVNFTARPESEFTAELIVATERAAGDTAGLVAAIAGFLLETLMRAKVRSTFVTGTSNLLQHPEFRDTARARSVLDYLSDETSLAHLPAPESEGVQIIIGPENIARELKDSSVVVAKYDAGDNMQGIIGVVGPTRMDYSKVAARLSFIASCLAQVTAAGQSVVPPGLQEHKKDEE